MCPLALPVTCYLTHLHTHNPSTSRLWEHGFYAFAEPDRGVPLAGTRAVLGLASEGDAFMHGVRAAGGAALTFGEIGYAITLDDIAAWARGAAVARPAITQHQDETGWQLRAVALPCTVTLGGDEDSGCILNAVLARGVSQDQARQHWEDGIEEIAYVEAAHQADDEQFWSHVPQLSGDWPANWRRGFVYDLETLRMVIRPSVGVIPYAWDGMQIQAPREVLAEAAMDSLFFSYAEPRLAAEVILGHFEAAPHRNLPCMREDGSYNMVADDGQVCGTAPEWGFPALSESGSLPALVAGASYRRGRLVSLCLLLGEWPGCLQSLWPAADRWHHHPACAPRRFASQHGAGRGDIGPLGRAP